MLLDFQAFDKLSDKFFLRLLADMISIAVLIRFVYYPIYKKKDYIFTFAIFNLIIFIITYLLNKVDMSMGAAFGLFAVFSMLRYRTEGISIKDMTYLFIVIALGLINAVTKGTYIELSIINLILILVTLALDGRLIMKTEMSQIVQYENIENIRPENRDKLMADLKARTGLNIHHVSVSRIDFMRDTALLNIYYYE